MRCQLALSYSLTRIDLIARRSSTQAPAPGDIHSRASHAYTHTHTHTHTHTPPPPPTHTHTHITHTHTHTNTHTHTHTHTFQVVVRGGDRRGSFDGANIPRPGHPVAQHYPIGAAWAKDGFFNKKHKAKLDSKYGGKNMAEAVCGVTPPTCVT
jgi:hypothetical protein